MKKKKEKRKKRKVSKNTRDKKEHKQTTRKGVTSPNKDFKHKKNA